MQPELPSDRSPDPVQVSRGDGPHVREGSEPGNCVNLDATDLPARGENLAQPPAVGVNLGFPRSLRIQGHEQALNDNRSLTGRGDDVCQNASQWNLGPVDRLVIVLGASVEFRPNFPLVGVEDL